MTPSVIPDPIAPTTEFASLVYGAGGVDIGDPAEAFHEASRLYPSVAPGRLATMVELAVSPGLQQTVARASRTHRHRPGVELPNPTLLRARFGDLLQCRRSVIANGLNPLQLSEISTIFASAYGCVELPDGDVRRPVPSGGALYPLELYLVAQAVAGLEQRTFHYDPFRHRLESLANASPRDVRAALVDPTIGERAAALVVVTAMFWRSRFKYGARGYRFALLEAGHVVQNIVLAAAALELTALPVGGFHDRLIDQLTGADGLDEATVYAVALGGRS